MIIPTSKLISPNDTDSVTVLALSTTHSYIYFGRSPIDLEWGWSGPPPPPPPWMKLCMVNGRMANGSLITSPLAANNIIITSPLYCHYIIIILCNSLHSTCALTALSRVYLGVVSTKLNPILYSANVVGYTASVTNTPRGVQLSLGGFSDQDIILRLINTTIRSERRIFLCMILIKDGHIGRALMGRVDI